MKFKIHFSIEEHEDFFIVEGESIDEAKANASKEIKKRGLSLIKNDLWSEEVK